MVDERSLTNPETACPLCDGASEESFEKDLFEIRDCRRCEHRFAVGPFAADHVASLYGDDYFFGGKDGYDDYCAEAALLQSHGRRYAKILSRFTAPGRMLDVGAAAGFVLQGFLDAGWAGEGLEPNATMCDFARSRLGLIVHESSLERFAGEETYDLVSMIQVIAHFQSPCEAMRAAARRLPRGGFCLIETWNYRSRTARLLGRRWHEYSPPSVLHWFSPSGLREAMETYGFRQVASGRPKKRLDGRHAKSLLSYKMQGSWAGRLAAQALRVVPDRLTIPYPAEDLFWTLFEKA